MAKQDRFTQVQDAVRAAEANGWTVLNGSTVRRKSEHSTPQYAKDNGWWTSDTYSTLEFISFVFGSRDRVPKVVYGTSTCAWTGRSDRDISFKRSLELLAQPLPDSEIHDRD